MKLATDSDAGVGRDPKAAIMSEFRAAPAPKHLFERAVGVPPKRQLGLTVPHSPPIGKSHIRPNGKESEGPKVRLAICSLGVPLTRLGSIRRRTPNTWSQLSQQESAA